MSAHFELFAGTFVDESGFVDGEFFDFGRKGDGSGDNSAGALGMVSDQFAGFVDDFVIEGFDFDADFLFAGHGFLVMCQ